MLGISIERGFEVLKGLRYWCGVGVCGSVDVVGGVDDCFSAGVSVGVDMFVGNGVDVGVGVGVFVDVGVRVTADRVGFVESVRVSLLLLLRVGPGIDVDMYCAIPPPNALSPSHATTSAQEFHSANLPATPPVPKSPSDHQRATAIQQGIQPSIPEGLPQRPYIQHPWGHPPRQHRARHPRPRGR